MRRMMDIRCKACGVVHVDKYVDLAKADACVCGGAFERMPTAECMGRAAGVIGDDIPGGVEIKHGLCNEDGSPRTFYSKTEIRAAAKAAGLRWGYDNTSHKTSKVSDRAPHTSRWV